MFLAVCQDSFPFAATIFTLLYLGYIPGHPRYSVLLPFVCCQPSLVLITYLSRYCHSTLYLRDHTQLGEHCSLKSDGELTEDRAWVSLISTLSTAPCIQGMSWNPTGKKSPVLILMIFLSHTHVFWNGTTSTGELIILGQKLCTLNAMGRLLINTHTK